MKASEIPNLISLLRIVLVIPVVWFLIARRFPEALFLFAFAGASDALDGWLAKRYGWQSHLGSLLDPLADKLLLVSSYVVLGWLTLIPAWLVVAVILRDVVIVTGALAYHTKVEHVSGEPLAISKLNTAAQILLVLVIVGSRAFGFVLPALTDLLILAVFLTTLGSGFAYVWLWGLRALRALKGSGH